MKINGNEYKIPELNFNTMCMLEDMGLSLTNMDKKVLGTVRAFLALAMDGDEKKAGAEIEAHLINGGNLEEFMSEINEAVQNSGFFQALMAKQAKGNALGKKDKEAKESK